MSAGKVFADGAYDNMLFLNVLQTMGSPCVKVRRNARVKKTNLILRNLSVTSQKKDLQGWKDRA